MAKRLGNDRRVWVANVAGTTFAMVKGNTELSINRSTGTIDATTKDEAPFTINLPGMRSHSLRASFKPDLPDVNGYERLEGAARAEATTPLRVQIRAGGDAGDDDDVEYDCEMYVTDDNTDAPQNNVMGASFTLVPAAKPLVDTLK